MKRKAFSLVLVTLVTVASLLLGSLGCAKPASPPALTPTPTMAPLELAKVTDMNIISTAPDSDRDGIADDVEELLGTDPHDRDTDHDGLTDYYEVFLKAEDVGVQTILDEDRDGKVAAVDNDDSAEVDTDGDGIPDMWELYGYTYNKITRKVEPWYVLENGQPKDGPYFDGAGNPIMYFKTEPNNKYTDGDPYDDYMETYGISLGKISMDNSVKQPGNRPVVPAYPDIIFSLTGFDVVSKGTITTTTGSHTEEHWANETTYERTTEDKWNVKESLDVEISTKKQGMTTSVVANQSHKVNTKHLVTKSNSGFEANDWYQATSSNPSEAAKLTLALKAENAGTAMAYNILPTVLITLGDKQIGLQYTPPANEIIASLAPGKTHGDAYIIGSGSEAGEITININQLSAVQLGVPMMLNVPQWRGEVKLQDEKGQYTAVGEWDAYRAQIDGVCANFSVDAGDGQAETYLVYATTGYTGPEIKLRDIIAWTVGYRETTDGIEIKGRPLEDYRIGFDPEHLENIKGQVGDGTNLMDLVVYSGSTINIKASEKPEPEIEWANYNIATSTVQAYVIDDYELKDVNLKAGEKYYEKYYPMKYDEDSSCYAASLPRDYMYTGREEVTATNDRGNKNTLGCELVEVSHVWSMFQYDTKHTSRSPYVGSGTAKQKWATKLFNPSDFDPAGSKWALNSPVISANGTIYVASIGLEGKIYAIDPDKGAIKWTFKRSPTYYQFYSTPAIGTDGTIYIGDDVSRYFAINPDGTRKWEYYFNKATYSWRNIFSSPAIGADGTIYFGHQDKKIFAFNPDGTLKWEYKTEGKVYAEGLVYSSPAIGTDGTIYVGSSDGYVHAINPSNGTMKWKTKYASDMFRSSPAIGTDGTIYIGKGNHYLVAIQPNGEKKWSYKTEGAIESSPSIGADGTIYFGAGDKYLYALKPDGKKKWSYKTGGAIESSPSIGADGTIYFGSSDKYIYALKPDGKLKWKYLTAGAVKSSPAIGADGTIYVLSYDGHLYAIGE